MSPKKFSALAAIVAASVAVTVAIQHRAEGRLRQGAESLGRQAQALADLSAENERLAALVERLKGAEPLTKAQLAELLRLRGQVGQLRQAVAERPRLQATNSQLRTAEAAAEKQLAEAQAAPNYWPKDQIAFAGFADPESAMKSFLWAMISGDIASWRANCTPEAAASLDNEWNLHGKSDAEAEARVRAMGHALTGPSSGFHILEQKPLSQDEVAVKLSFDGEGTSRTFVLKRIGNEWKFGELLFAGQSPPSRPNP